MHLNHLSNCIALCDKQVPTPLNSQPPIPKNAFYDVMDTDKIYLPKLFKIAVPMTLNTRDGMVENPSRSLMAGLSPQQCYNHCLDKLSGPPFFFNLYVNGSSQYCSCSPRPARSKMPLSGDVVFSTCHRVAIRARLSRTMTSPGKKIKVVIQLRNNDKKRRIKSGTPKEPMIGAQLAYPPNGIVFTKALQFPPIKPGIHNKRQADLSTATINWYGSIPPGKKRKIIAYFKVRICSQQSFEDQCQLLTFFYPSILSLELSIRLKRQQKAYIILLCLHSNWMSKACLFALIHLHL